MKEFSYIVKNKNGIHARPAGKIVTLAKGYECSIRIYKEEKEADAKRLLSVMGLGATKGAELVFKLEGKDEEKAEAELKKLLQELQSEE